MNSRTSPVYHAQKQKGFLSILKDFFRGLTVGDNLEKQLVIQDIKGMYRKSLLGMLWAVITPIAFYICANNCFEGVSELTEASKAFQLDALFNVAILNEPPYSIEYKNLPSDEIIWVHEEFSFQMNSLIDTYPLALRNVNLN